MDGAAFPNDGSVNGSSAGANSGSGGGGCNPEETTLVMPVVQVLL